MLKGSSKVIIYPGENNKVIVLFPAIGIIDIEEYARKIFPPGSRYKIISSFDLPEDRTFREAWEYSDD